MMHPFKECLCSHFNCHCLWKPTPSICPILLLSSTAILQQFSCGVLSRQFDWLLRCEPFCFNVHESFCFMVCESSDLAVQAVAHREAEAVIELCGRRASPWLSAFVPDLLIAGLGPTVSSASDSSHTYSQVIGPDCHRLQYQSIA